jgi:hypothetical protein
MKTSSRARHLHRGYKSSPSQTRSLSNSPPRWSIVPALEKVKLNLQNRGLASAMSSFTEVTRKLVVVTMIDVAIDNLEIRADFF